MAQSGNQKNDQSPDTASRPENFEASKDSASRPPEPPKSWRPSEDHATMHDLQEYNTNVRFENEQSADLRFNSNGANTVDELRGLQKKITIARICAIVSLFVGGVLLSAVSVVFAYRAWRALADLMQRKLVNDATQALFKRAIVATVVMGLIALVANAVSMVIMYPMIMQMMETGDASQVFPWLQSGGPSSSAGSGYETWG